ncbi:MAG: hypothetical protein AB7S50_14235 [Bacteroidales bacterium]
MKYSAFFILALFPFSLLRAQKVSNVNSLQDGNIIRVTYQVSETIPSQLMKVNLYYSINDGAYIGPLQKVNGDVGDNLSGNGTKTINWDVLSEVSNLEGNVKFKVDILPKPNTQMPVALGKDMKAAVESCVLENNSLTINFILESAIDQEWYFLTNFTFLFDEFGEKKFANSFRWGTNTESNNNIYLMKNVPFRISFIFNDVNVNMRIIKALELFYSYNKIQFRDLPIIRK